MYRVCIITHLKYLRQRRRHNGDRVYSADQPYFDLNPFRFFLFPRITGSLKPKHLTVVQGPFPRPLLYKRSSISPFNGSCTKATAAQTCDKVSMGSSRYLFFVGPVYSSPLCTNSRHVK